MSIIKFKKNLNQYNSHEQTKEKSGINRCRKSTRENLIPTHEKNSKKTRNRSKFLIIKKKNLQKNLKTNIIPNSERLFPHKNQEQARCPISPLLFNIALKLNQFNKANKSNKRHTDQKGKKCPYLQMI